MQNKKSKSLSDLQSLISEDDKIKLATEKEKRDKQASDAKQKISAMSIKEMNVQFFPHFIRIHFPVLKNENNELLCVLGNEFKAYLKEVFRDDTKRLEKIWDIEPKTVVMNQMTDPFTCKGYDPVFVLHFCEFIEKMKRKNPIP